MKKLAPSYVLTLKVFLLGIFFLSPTLPTYAGCGCEKPPPPPAAIRPTATYAGREATLFHTSLIGGQPYTVTFTAMNGQSSSVSAQAVSRRDLANGQVKPHLSVKVPTLPLGPTRVSVSGSGQRAPFLSVPDTDFVIVPTPVVVPSQIGKYRYQNYQAAVGRNGVVYLSLDVTGITLPRTLKAQAKGYALRFSAENTVFYNTQGFLMQALYQNMPGLGSVASTSGTDSDILTYSRHEFNTFFLQHDERQEHKLDPDDANWHTDGTPHIDHDHLILTLVGKLNGAPPTAGATPAFELVLDTYSLFHHGLFGASGIEMSNKGGTGSYDSRTGVFKAQGDIFSNGQVKLDNHAVVNGNATGATFVIAHGAKVNGVRSSTTGATPLMPVQKPRSLPKLGDLVLDKASRTLTGPASYEVGKIALSKGMLFINNSAGPVTLYVTADVTVSGDSRISVADPDPEKFAIYVVGSGAVTLDNTGIFYGVVYAPQSLVGLSNYGQFFGAFVGNQVKIDNNAKVHYDTALRGE